jgi:hypothetical protein
MFRYKIILLSALVIMFANWAYADDITYDVTVNTSSITGAVGSLDFNFNPGPLVTQAASLQILSFSSDGTLGGSPTLTGEVSGALPASLTFNNGTGFNDYFEGFKFGSILTFDVRLFGPALIAPDGVSSSGSTFAFSMFSNPAGTVPALTTDTTDGFAYIIAVNLDGSTTVNNFSTQSNVVPPMSAVPELSSGMLLGTTIAFGMLWLLGRHIRSRPRLQNPPADS